MPSKIEQAAQAVESDSTTQGLGWLKKVNDFLEGVPMMVPSFFDALFKSGEATSQGAVDMACIWIAWVVNINVERMRQKVIKILYKQYMDNFIILAPVTKLKNAFSSPMGAIGAVASVVKSILDPLIGPFKIVIKFVIELGKELWRLAENLANIASITPPDPPNPDINCNAFKDNLQIGSISMGMILEDPSSMPTPEQKFPEPPKPFVSKEYWIAVAESGTVSYNENKVFISGKYKGNTVGGGQVKREFEIKDSPLNDKISGGDLGSGDSIV